MIAIIFQTVSNDSFVLVEQGLQSFYKKVPGDAFRLECEALAVPPPTTQWIHDKVHIYKIDKDFWYILYEIFSLAFA